MAIVKMTVYPYMVLDKKGKFSYWGVGTTPRKDEVQLDYGYFIIGMPGVEIEVNSPDERQIDAAALSLLRQHREKVKGEFAATMTRLQILENELLKLEAPQGVEVLQRDDMQQFGTPGENHGDDIEDAEVRVVRPGGVNPDDDDIPF